MNVAHVPHEEAAIYTAIKEGIANTDYREAIKLADNPYGHGNTGPAVARILTDLDLGDAKLLAKQTHLPPQ
jgi:UDP-N-acetylglucosamine 2-epimerase